MVPYAVMMHGIFAETQPLPVARSFPKNTPRYGEMTRETGIYGGGEVNAIRKDMYTIVYARE